MLLLIDGYNLLHQSDLLGRRRGARWLQQARDRLVQRLAERLDATLAAETVVVFDAASPPAHLPDRYRIAGIRVMYAVGYPEADDLLEELIARHPAPRRLTVISSDHRVQRAARRRRATPLDAEAWYARLIDQGPQLAIAWPAAGPPATPGPPHADPEKPLAPVDADAVQQWMDTFQLPPRTAGPDPSAPRGDSPPAPRQRAAEPATQKKPTPTTQKKPTTRGKPPPSSTSAKPPTPGRREAETPQRAQERTQRPRRQLDPEAENPFPEGYGEDLLP